MTTLKPTPTPGEQLGELIGLIHQTEMAWSVYLKRTTAGEGWFATQNARDMWDRTLTASVKARGALADRMERDRLAQVTTLGYKARVEDDELMIYRVTPEGEQRWPSDEA